jgi:hypothetical protein
VVLVALVLAAGAVSEAREGSWTGAAVLAALVVLLVAAAVVSLRQLRGR